MAICGDVARSVVGIGRLNDVGALSDPQDDIAAMSVQRLADEARGVGIECVGDRLAELMSEKFGDLVFETFAGLVGERKIARVCAGAENVRIDQFDRALRILRSAARPARPTRADACESQARKDKPAIKRCRRDRIAIGSHQSGPMHLSSAAVKAAGFGACLSGRPRPTAPVERARR